jgi:hypothetical protein
MAGGTPHNGPETGQELLHLEGLGQLIVRTRIDTLDALVPTAPRSEDQHREGLPGLAPSPDDRQAVHAGQTEIQDDGRIGFGVPLEQASSPSDSWSTT